MQKLEVSELAWVVLSLGALDFVTIPDSAAEAAMRMLARGEAGEGSERIVQGESGVAGLAGLLAAAGDTSARAELALDAYAKVLLIGTEGATDPPFYERIVGVPPGQVAAG